MSESPGSTSPSPSEPIGETRYHGIAVSPGVAKGPVVVYRPDEQIVRKRRIKPEDVPKEIARLEQALLDTRHQIQAIRTQLSESLGETDASIFDVHLLVVEDATIIDAVKSQLEERLLNIDFLYQQMATSYARRMREIDDEYLRERAQDILDVSRRVIRNLHGVKADHTVQLDVPSIIFAHDLTPSDTALFDRKMVLGFVTETGSRTSHAAIMARSLNIPALSGVKELDGDLDLGDEVLLDGYEGILIVAPTPQTQFEYGQVEARRHQVEEKLVELRETVAVTTDQRRVIVSANVELPEDLPLVQENGAEGIGLCRTEFLFLNRDDIPSEDEQFELYRNVAKAAAPHSVIIRTLDIGGDKMLPYLGIETEMNPFLGWRGVRFCLDQTEIFHTQLRAICRASAEGNVRIMFPMVSDISEVRRCREALSRAQEELRGAGVPIAERIETGIMIEVPSAVLTADILAEEVDFFSIGTNDLIQYTMAVDRGNERVSNLYRPTHPAIIRMIHQTVEAAHRHKIWVGVCGEMASDLTLIPLLVGLGVDELSLGAIFVPRIKRVIQALNYQETQSLAQRLLAGRSAEENLEALTELARRLYPEIL